MLKRDIQQEIGNMYIDKDTKQKVKNKLDGTYIKVTITIKSSGCLQVVFGPLSIDYICNSSYLNLKVLIRLQRCLFRSQRGLFRSRRGLYCSQLGLFRSQQGLFRSQHGVLLGFRSFKFSWIY